MIIDTQEINRVEVIDEKGRVLVRHNITVVIDVQDDGRTVKIFIKDTHEVRSK